jgi:holo-[acyl-carrier protein] synthase
VAISVGIDLVAVDEVRESVHLLGERYLNRTYTEVEQRDCQSDPRRLAGCFAAKEATVKALRLLDEPLSWRSIEIAHDASGRPSIRLAGEAAAVADRRGILRFDLSLTLRGSVALAVVLAETEDGVSPAAGSAPGAA